METATWTFSKTNPPCPSCIPPFLKLHCCFPVGHPTDLTRALFGLADAVPVARLCQRPPRWRWGTAPATEEPRDACLYLDENKIPFFHCWEAFQSRPRQRDVLAARCHLWHAVRLRPGSCATALLSPQHWHRVRDPARAATEGQQSGHRETAGVL